jgi:hypothetical protein
VRCFDVKLGEGGQGWQGIAAPPGCESHDLASSY